MLNNVYDVKAEYFKKKEVVGANKVMVISAMVNLLHLWKEGSAPILI